MGARETGTQPEPQSLGLIKEKIGGRYGMLDLLDVFVEADRLACHPLIPRR
jgi:hypothetical protein